jgi:ubiquinone/menaquinone biosynthesis C-methylase UbiE
MLRLPPEFSYLQGKVLSGRVYPEFFSLHGSERVLNAGFGDGPQAIIYAGKFRQMIGVDIQAERLERARKMLRALGIQNVELVTANVESIPLSDASFDVILAIDIIEHVEHPEQFLREMRRLLIPGGQLVITFPAMHDRFMDTMSAIGRVLKPWKKREPHPTGWHPDHHQHEYPVSVWRKMVEAAGFHFEQSRATTMFPPLHLYGIPRFWFSSEWIHRIDRWFVSRSSLQKFGQTVMATFTKSSA